MLILNQQESKYYPVMIENSEKVFCHIANWNKI